MKCPECDGTGKVVHPMMSMNGNEYTGEWEQHECEACGGTGEIQQTNEEWIKQCTTEQLAEILAWIEDRGELPTVRKENVKAFEKWLKQPHTTKE